MTIGSLTPSGRITSTIRSERLFNHVNDYIASAASVAGKSNIMWTTATLPSTYVANSNLWLPEVDFSCSPVWIYASGYNTPNRGCLITPIHLIQASHAGMGLGESFGFKGTDGIVYTRTIAARDRTYAAYDIQINRLDSALPGAVTPAKMFDTTVDTYLTSGDFETGVNSVVIDAELKLLSKKWSGYYSNDAFIVNATATNIVDYTETLIPGDSGSANFLIVNGVPVVITTNHNSYSGPAYSKYRTEIDAAIATLGGGYSAQTFDLSEFLV